MTAAAGTAAGGYAYYWATKEMGADAVSRMASYNTVAVPAILNYKLVEARYEKLPKVAPTLFPEISTDELTKRYEVIHYHWAPCPTPCSR